MEYREDTITKICSDIRQCTSNSNLETIYLGGGTPSVLSQNDISRIFCAIHETFPNSAIKESTIEVNPDDITKEYCDMLIYQGIDRISIGIQSFFDSHLKAMNRRHNGSQAKQAILDAQSAGFKNITVDLIYGLPFMTEEQWAENLDTLIGYGVQHISAYHLTIEEGTIFAKKKLQAVPESVSEKHYKILCEKLESAGFHHYEISNFAKPGFEAIHNSGYWNGKPYIGIGPSAHSFDGVNRRYWQPSDIKSWLEGEKPEEEFLTPEQRKEEIIMTALRTANGLETADSEIICKANRFIKDGKMSYDCGILRILPEYYLLSDYIIGELI